VVRDHNEQRARVKLVAQERKCGGQSRQLVIHGNANCLEQAGEITRSRASAECAADCINEIIAYAQRFSSAATHDLTREPAGARLVTVIAKNVG